MTKIIAPRIAKKIALFLENKDLKSLAIGLRQFRHDAVEQVIQRELIHYKRTKLDILEQRLIICAKLGMTDWVLKYIKAGADVNVSLNVRNLKLQAIHYAALSGVFSCVKVLVDNGAVFPLEKTRFALSPLHFAAAGGNPDSVALFIALGIPIDQESPERFWLGSKSTSLQIAAYHKKPACVAILLSKGAQVDHVKTNGMQAIHVAVEKPDNAEVIKLLLNAKANPNAVTPQGVTPLLQALGLFECGANIQVLLQGGANPRQPHVLNHHMLPLQHLISNQQIPEALILLNFDPTLIDAVIPMPKGFKKPYIWYADRTALHIAIMFKYEEGVKFLLEHNANKEIPTRGGKKAIDLAIKKSQIAKLLEGKSQAFRPGL